MLLLIPTMVFAQGKGKGGKDDAEMSAEMKEALDNVDANAVIRLLNNGHYPHAPDGIYQYDPLSYILSKKSPSRELLETAKALIRWQAVIDQPNAYGESVLHIVAGTNYVALMRFIVTERRNANFMVENDAGQTPYDVATSDEMRALLSSRMSTESQPTVVVNQFVNCTFNIVNVTESGGRVPSGERGSAQGFGSMQALGWSQPGRNSRQLQ